MQDIWGVEYRFVEFSDQGGYFEAVKRPLADADSTEALDAHRWSSLDWFDYSALHDQLVWYDKYAIMTAPGFSSPGPLLTLPNMMGEEKAWTDMIAAPELFDAAMARVMEFLVAFVDRMLEASEGRIDFFRIGDDFGGQQGLLFGVDLWKARLQPALRRLGDIARSRNAHYCRHSCGSVRDLIPDLIDTGVEELLDATALGRGFFIGPTHNFQVDVPTENILAMYEAAKVWTP